MKTADIELAIANYFNYRRNIIVPNVSWGLWLHECDILVVTQAGYAIEVEIKVSKADLKKDALKRHGHIDPRIKALYFAIPKSLIQCADLVPERAGIIAVAEGGYCEIGRKPIVNKEAKRLTFEEHIKVIHLGAMRIWKLKKKLKDLKNLRCE